MESRAYDSMASGKSFIFLSELSSGLMISNRRFTLNHEPFQAPILNGLLVDSGNSGSLYFYE